AHRDDGMLEADHLRLVAAHPDGPRVLESAVAADDLHALGLGHGREPARELAYHAIGFPFAQGIEGDARLAEVDAESLGPLSLAEHGRDVEERLGGNAPLVETGPAQALARLHDDRLESELRAAEGGRVASGPAPQHGHVDFGHQIAHHHAFDLAAICITCIYS